MKEQLTKKESFNIRHNTPRVESEYFIDRYGRVVKYKGEIDRQIVSMHYEIAHQEYPEIEYPKSPDDVVMKMGWVMIGSSCYGGAIAEKEPTQSQINKLFDLGFLDIFCVLQNGFYVKFQKH